MIENMDPNDILQCVQRGNISSSEIDQARAAINAPVPTSIVSDKDLVETGIIQQAVQQFSSDEINKMLKAVTKDSIVQAMNAIKDADGKRRAIVTMCLKAGITDYSIATRKNGKLTIHDSDGDAVDISDVIDICATKRAIVFKNDLMRNMTLFRRQRAAITGAAAMRTQGVDPDVLGMQLQALIEKEDSALPYQAIDILRAAFENKEDSKGRSIDFDNDFSERKGKLYGKIPGITGSGTITGEDVQFLMERMTKPKTSISSSIASSSGFTINDLKAIRADENVPYEAKALIDQINPDFLNKSENVNGYLHAAIPGWGKGPIYGSDIAELVGNKFGRSRFGRRGLTLHQRKFKKAAKSCKGKRNYRSCMKKTLKKKKTVRRRSTVPGVRRKYTSGGGRKSPGVSATLYPIGTVRKGLDGNKWKIKKASNGVKRWARM